MEEAAGIGCLGCLAGYDKQRSRHCLGNYISYTGQIMAGSPCGEIRPKIQTPRFCATNPGPGNRRKSAVTGNIGGRDG